MAFSGISLPQNLQGAIWSAARRFFVDKSSERRWGARFSSRSPHLEQAAALTSYGVLHSGQRMVGINNCKRVAMMPVCLIADRTGIGCYLTRLACASVICRETKNTVLNLRRQHRKEIQDENTR